MITIYTWTALFVYKAVREKAVETCHHTRQYI